MGKYHFAAPGTNPIDNPILRKRGKPWFWILLLAALIGCGVTFGVTRLSAQADSSKADATPTYVVEVSSATRTPTPGASRTATVSGTPASTQTPWIITQVVERNVEVIRITVMVVDKQVIVPQDRAVIVTVKVPWVITLMVPVEVTTTPLPTYTPRPTYTPYPTQTKGPSQTPWVITATLMETATSTATSSPTEPMTPTETVTVTLGVETGTETATAVP
jgi:hypothetical protein